MTDHEKDILEAYERGYAKGVADERQRSIGSDPNMFRMPWWPNDYIPPVYGPGIGPATCKEHP